MDVPIGDRSERDPTHRQVLASGTPSTAWVTPRSRTASRAAWAGAGGLAPSRWRMAVGLPACQQAHRVQRPAPIGAGHYG